MRDEKWTHLGAQKSRNLWRRTAFGESQSEAGTGQEALPSNGKALVRPVSVNSRPSEPLVASQALRDEGIRRSAVTSDAFLRAAHPGSAFRTPVALDEALTGSAKLVAEHSRAARIKPSRESRPSLSRNFTGRNSEQAIAMGKGRGVRTAKRKTKPEEQLVNRFAAQHGHYERNMRFVVNRGGTAIDRWKRDGLLSDTQQAAILHCQALWRAIDCGPRLVANLDRTVFGSHGDGHPREVEARSDLHRIKSGFPLAFWDVFEMVCRHDEPAGTAGSRLANDSRSASSAARNVVALIADTIWMRERLSY